MAKVAWEGPHAPSSVMSTGSMCDGARELLQRQCTVNTEVRTCMGESSQTL